MSSSDKTDSLSELATKVLEVEKRLNTERMDAVTFRTLKVLINKLQTQCPNHPGILDARVRWYGMLLENFEFEVVIPIEQGVELDFRCIYNDDMSSNYPQIYPQIFATPDIIQHFLRRSYLKEEFPRFYERVIRLLNRLVGPEFPQIGPEYRILLRDEILIPLQEKFLAGHI